MRIGEVVLSLAATLAAVAPVQADDPWRPIMDGPCGGKRVPIGLVLGRRECEVDCKARGPVQGLVAQLQLAAPRVSPGGAVKVRAVLRNTTQAALVLPFVWHAGPMFVATARNSDGTPVPIEGTVPAITDAFRPGPPYLVCLRLAPGGEAFVEGEWRAVRWRYAATGSGPGQLPTEPAGPLPAGRYLVSLQTMLQDPIGAPAAPIEVR